MWVGALGRPALPLVHLPVLSLALGAAVLRLPAARAAAQAHSALATTVAGRRSLHSLKSALHACCCGSERWWVLTLQRRLQVPYAGLVVSNLQYIYPQLGQYMLATAQSQFCLLVRL